VGAAEKAFTIPEESTGRVLERLEQLGLLPVAVER